MELIRTNIIGLKSIQSTEGLPADVAGDIACLHLAEYLFDQPNSIQLAYLSISIASLVEFVEN